MLIKNFFICLVLLLASTHKVEAHEEVPVELKDVGIGDNLGQQIDLNNSFVDIEGKEKKLAEYFDGNRPVILAMVYFECPNLCTFVLNELLSGLKDLKWNVGDEFQVVAVSINPNDTAELALKKSEAYIKEYDRPNTKNGWHFLTGPETHSKSLAEQIGFHYKYDEEQKQYAHAAGIFVLTPDGHLSRILYGLNYRAQDLKLALLEAAKGKIGTITDRILMFCYHYDPKGKRYALWATRLMQMGGGITVLVILLMLYRGTRQKPSRQ